MAKRGATSELNHNNWDEEEEPEEAGVFVQADKETLQHRVIKKAKRRGTGSEDGAKTAFSGFGGLTGSVTKSNTFSGFSLAPGGSSVSAFQGSKLTAPSEGSSGLFSGASSSKVQPLNGSKEQTTDGSKPGGWSNKREEDWKDSPEYFNFLKDLNLSVLAWIKQHVEENPYIILTPIFKDYEHYLQNQEKEARSTSAAELSTPAKKDTVHNEDNSKSTLSAAASTKPSEDKAKTLAVQADSKDKLSASDKKEADQSSPSVSTGNGSNTQKGFSFGATSLSGSGANFSFGGMSNPTSSAASSTFGKSGFSFGATNTTTLTTTSSGFSFGTTSSGLGKPFSFGTSSSTPATFSFGTSAIQTGTSSGGTSQDTNGKNDDEDYVPPKPEVREIKEDDALYTKRCKLFFQRGEQWVDKGVGNLHLKPVGESKTQILVRADTNLGNILLNVMLSASMPVSRRGKNNVVVICVPNPPLDANAKEGDQNKPVSMLIRVKAEEDADELFGKIEERKKLL